MGQIEENEVRGDARGVLGGGDETGDGEGVDLFVDDEVEGAGVAEGGGEGAAGI